MYWRRPRRRTSGVNSKSFPTGWILRWASADLRFPAGRSSARPSLARWYVIRAILVLDDALASVDTYTEETILRQLREVMVDRTTIFISHRISTVRHADRIAVLVNGRIAELGTHEELLSLGHFYANLYEKQLLEEELAVAGD